MPALIGGMAKTVTFPQLIRTKFGPHVAGPRHISSPFFIVGNFPNSKNKCSLNSPSEKISWKVYSKFLECVGAGVPTKQSLKIGSAPFISVWGRGRHWVWRCECCAVEGPSDRLMGVVIGVSISSGCIVVCVIIILLRNRFDWLASLDTVVH